jgi:UDP-galactopyranose mutase
MYDIVIVGAGLTAATICAKLKNKYKILVVDGRNHIGGNCYDYKSNGTMIHRFGPHIMHSPDAGVIDFLSSYTAWTENYIHKVTAELEDGTRVPFPYSKETVAKIGKELSHQEVIDIFFKPYSQKMWDVDWDKLPDIIKNRIPKINEKSDYFANQFTGFPRDGYTVMMNKMFEGVEIVLGVSPTYWLNFKDVKKIIYCGRPDLIPNKNGFKMGSINGDWLTYRNLDFTFKLEEWDADTSVVNFCHMKTPYTRKTSFKCVFGGKSNIVTYETPKMAGVTDLTPFYFYPSCENTSKHIKIKRLIKEQYPNLILAGRLGTSSYIDMWQCVKMGIGIVEDFS